MYHLELARTVKNYGPGGAAVLGPPEIDFILLFAKYKQVKGGWIFGLENFDFIEGFGELSEGGENCLLITPRILSLFQIV